MKKLIAILLAFSVLISATGMVKITHHCAIVADAIKAGFNEADCSDVNCCSIEKESSENCCENEVKFITNDGQSDFAFSYIHSVDQSDHDFNSAAKGYTEVNKISQSLNDFISYFNKPPPQKYKLKKHIAFASFLC